VTVYVDAAIYKKPNGRVKYCHMTADTETELRFFAMKVGIGSHWFHRSRSGIPHYDLNPSNRRVAILNRAVEK
jgi:Protein of unknown function (DUF4031)